MVFANVLGKIGIPKHLFKLKHHRWFFLLKSDEGVIWLVAAGVWHELQPRAATDGSKTRK